MIQKLTEENGKWGLEVNIKTIEYMCVRREQRKLILEQEQIESKDLNKVEYRRMYWVIHRMEGEREEDYYGEVELTKSPNKRGVN